MTLVTRDRLGSRTGTLRVTIGLRGLLDRTMLAEARVARPSRGLPIDGHRTSAQSDGRLLVENLVRSWPMRTRSDKRPQGREAAFLQVRAEESK